MTHEQIKDISGLMVMLGTDTERKFAWAVGEVDGKDMIYLFKSRKGFTTLSEKSFVTAFPADAIIEGLKLLK